MAIPAGTTGTYNIDFQTSSCVPCHAPNTFWIEKDSFDPFNPAPIPLGWIVSWEDQTVWVPPEAEPGQYYGSVRTSIQGGPCAPCRHISFVVSEPVMDPPPPDAPPPCG